MTKLQKLEREKKIWRYVPIISTLFVLLLLGAAIFTSTSTSNNSALIVLIITLLVCLVMNYVIQMYNAKLAIENCDFAIKQELLKPEIIKQFHLSTEEYVEVFWNDEADKDKFSFSIERNYRNYGGRFYAKLISDDEIEIIIKGPNGEIIEEPKRTIRFSYLREHYKAKP